MDNDTAMFIREETGKSYASDWLEVDQAMIDAFADTTRDWNFLHVDPEAAASTEFGSTIAHGFLVLSLLAPMRQSLPRPRFPGLRMGVNYGLERVRWVQPVLSGKRIRGRFAIASVAPVHHASSASSCVRECCAARAVSSGAGPPNVLRISTK